MQGVHEVEVLAHHARCTVRECSGLLYCIWGMLQLEYRALLVPLLCANRDSLNFDSHVKNEKK